MIGGLFEFANKTAPFMEIKLLSKETIKMLEMMVFAITLVVSNLVTTLILLKVLMSERVLKKYMKTVSNMTVEVSEEIYRQMEEKLD